MEGLTRQQFFEEYEHEPDIVKVMTDYRKQFNERLTAETFRQYLDSPIEEEDEND